MRYSVVGLGKLGCSMAAAIASRGGTVVGYDVSADVVNRLNAGVAPVSETGLQELIDDNRSRLSATHSVAEAVHESDMTFVVVPTPSDASGAFTLRYAVDAFGAIGHALSTKREQHVVVLTSTVLPGSVRYGLIPALEQGAARCVGDGIGVCYSPAFIALGTVVRDFLTPDFVLIGESDEAAGEMLAACYQAIMPLQPAIVRMSLENAELTKLAVNTFVTTKISFANMLATLCERIPGGDVDVVSNALGLDRRIGRAYLTGALGYGGPCFPRDNQALSFLARALATRAPIAEATDLVNRALPATVLERLEDRVGPGVTVAVLGLAYKPDTAVVEESQSVEIVRALAATGARVLAHDPLAASAASAVLPATVEIRADVHGILQAADVVLVTTNDAAYATLPASAFTRPGSRPLVIDFWRALRAELDGIEGVEYIAFGVAAGERSEDLRQLWMDPEAHSAATA